MILGKFQLNFGKGALWEAIGKCTLQCLRMLGFTWDFKETPNCAAVCWTYTI